MRKYTDQIINQILFLLLTKFNSKKATLVSSSKIFTFADDTKIVHPINSSYDVGSLQTDLDTIISWSSRNNMDLNKDKFVLISHKFTKSVNNQLELFNELPFNSTYQVYTTGDDNIFPSRVVRDLGILINSRLNWEDHI